MVKVFVRLGMVAKIAHIWGDWAKPRIKPILGDLKILRE